MGEVNISIGLRDHAHSQRICRTTGFQRVIDVDNKEANILLRSNGGSSTICAPLPTRVSFTIVEPQQR